MTFKCISTGSNGNGYLLESETSVLIIEAGKGMFKKILANIPEEKKLVGLIYSHKHSDHYGDVQKFGEVTNIIRFERNRYEDEHFIIKRFLVYHDVECFGFAIWCKDEQKTFVFITDFTKILEQDVYRLKINFLAIELSYNEMIYSKMTDDEKFGLKNHSSDYHTIGVIRKMQVNHPLIKIVTIHKSERACNYGLTNKQLFQNFGLKAEIISEGKIYNF